MAKRKRLSPAVFSGIPEDLETKTMGPAAPGSGAVSGTPPIAGVAGDAATHAALSDVIETLERARREGRMVLELDPERIDAAYLMRDRTRVDEAEMEALVTSISVRGQQTPIEVVETQGGYGLISGWRRLTALKRLGDRPVLALLRRPHDAPDAYLAMIEENEIRVGLSYYERARIVVKSVAGGVFDTEKAALQSLFRAASRAKRSKIKSFIPIVTHLDGALRYPEDLGERLGLHLSRLLEQDAALAPRLIQALLDPVEDAASEQALIQGVLTEKSKYTPFPAPLSPPSSRRLVPGLTAHTRPDGSLLISGPALTPAIVREVQDWLRLRMDTDRR